MKPAPNPKILLVDDDEALCECLHYFLKEAGFLVDFLTDSRQVRPKLAEGGGNYDLLIVDNCMPHVTGGELIDEARRAGFQGKIVMYSGSITAAQENEFRSLGADLVLRKGVDLMGIVPTISELVRGDGADGELPA